MDAPGASCTGGEHRSPGGEWTRALREQAHFPVYSTLFHSPPGGISKMINTTTTERTVYHGLQRVARALSVVQNPIRIRELRYHAAHWHRAPGSFVRKTRDPKLSSMMTQFVNCR